MLHIYVISANFHCFLQLSSNFCHFNQFLPISVIVNSSNISAICSIAAYFNKFMQISRISEYLQIPVIYAILLKFRNFLQFPHISWISEHFCIFSHFHNFMQIFYFCSHCLKILDIVCSSRNVWEQMWQFWIYQKVVHTGSSKLERVEKNKNKLNQLKYTNFGSSIFELSTSGEIL